jgi:hypothetical protein
MSCINKSMPCCVPRASVACVPECRQPNRAEQSMLVEFLNALYLLPSGNWVVHRRINSPSDACCRCSQPCHDEQEHARANVVIKLGR